MAQWGTLDNANSSVLWAAQQVKLAPTAANRNALYGNYTANAVIAGVTVGMFGIDKTELSSGSISHTGWVLKTTGQGGRAGRTQTEVLVAGRMANSTGGY